MLCVSLTEIDIWLMVSFINTHKHTHTLTHLPHAHWEVVSLFGLAEAWAHISRVRDGQKGMFAKFCFLYWLLSRDVEGDPANLSLGSPVLHLGSRQR